VHLGFRSGLLRIVLGYCALALAAFGLARRTEPLGVVSSVAAGLVLFVVPAGLRPASRSIARGVLTACRPTLALLLVAGVGSGFGAGLVGAAGWLGADLGPRADRRSGGPVDVVVETDARSRSAAAGVLAGRLAAARGLTDAAPLPATLIPALDGDGRPVVVLALPWADAGAFGGHPGETGLPAVPASGSASGSALVGPGTATSGGVVELLVGFSRVRLPVGGRISGEGIPGFAGVLDTSWRGLPVVVVDESTVATLPDAPRRHLLLLSATGTAAQGRIVSGELRRTVALILEDLEVPTPTTAPTTEPATAPTTAPPSDPLVVDPLVPVPVVVDPPGAPVAAADASAESGDLFIEADEASVAGLDAPGTPAALLPVPAVPGSTAPPVEVVDLRAGSAAEIRRESDRGRLAGAAAALLGGPALLVLPGVVAAALLRRLRRTLDAAVLSGAWPWRASWAVVGPAWLVLAAGLIVGGGGAWVAVRAIGGPTPGAGSGAGVAAGATVAVVVALVVLAGFGAHAAGVARRRLVVVGVAVGSGALLLVRSAPARASLAAAAVLVVVGVAVSGVRASRRSPLALLRSPVAASGPLCGALAGLAVGGVPPAVLAVGDGGGPGNAGSSELTGNTGLMGLAIGIVVAVVVTLVAALRARAADTDPSASDPVVAAGRARLGQLERGAMLVAPAVSGAVGAVATTLHGLHPVRGAALAGIGVALLGIAVTLADPDGPADPADPAGPLRRSRLIRSTRDTRGGAPG
jgi:hypothetical protein